MHDRELFEKAFSPLHASPDTLTEVRKTMRNEKKTRRALGKGAVIAIAVALTLTVAVASGIVTLIKADVSPADKVDDATHRAFTDDIDAAAPVVDDGKGGLVPVPDMERIPGDVQTTQRLVGQYLSKLDAEMTVDSNTIKLGTFLIDENGLGLLTYSVENPSGVGYTVAEARVDGYGTRVEGHNPGTVPFGDTAEVLIINYDDTTPPPDPDPDPDPKPDPDPGPDPMPDPDPHPTPDPDESPDPDMPDTPDEPGHPDEPDDSVPTGDTAQLALYLALLAASLAGAAAIVILGRKGRKRD